MLRVLILATLFSMAQAAPAGQPVGVLHIRIALLDAERKATPVPRHVLLISDNPASSAPRRVVTALDGTASVRLRPGNYTVESDRPVAFLGQAYQWTQTVDIAAGSDAVLELTPRNAEVGPVTATAIDATAAPEAEPASLLTVWQDSVVALWTPTTHGSAFLIDASGLMVTNQQVIGTATVVEVQISPAVKVAATVLAADPAKNVAVLWIDPKVAASLRPLPLGCAQAVKPTVTGGQEIVTIGVPLREPKDSATGTVSRVQPHAIVSDLMLAPGSEGGPVFTASGGMIGITSLLDREQARWRGDSQVVRIDEVCEVVAAAEKKMRGGTPPSGTHLPVEPVQPFPEEALQAADPRRANNLSPYQVSSADFDILFITPVLIYGAQHPPDRTNSSDTRRAEPEPTRFRPLSDFSNWSEYVADIRPVLMVRVTPKQVEGFWTKVARGAAQTQGVSLPPMKHFKTGFSKMRASCGNAEVPPIHPFKLEQRISETDAIHEGLYVFDPGALGPHCASVTLTLYSEKEPDRGDARVVDPKIVQQVWQDFAPYRALK